MYSTLAVTLERFFAIVFPFKDFDNVKKWLMPAVAIFAVVYNLPKFFELSTVVDPSTNATVITASGLRENPVYRTVYFFWSKFLLIEVIPYVLVVIMNSFIIFKIVQSSRFRQKIVANMSAQTPFKDVAGTDPSKLQSMSEEQIKFFENQRQEHKLGVMLVAISLLFVTCQSFKLIPDVYEALFCMHKGTGECTAPAFVNKVVDLSHLLVCFNSAANFVIYLLGGEKFRRAWVETYLPWSCLLYCHCVKGSKPVAANNSMLHYDHSRCSIRRNNSFRTSYLKRPHTQLVRLDKQNGAGSGSFSRTGSTTGSSRCSPPEAATHRMLPHEQWLNIPANHSARSSPNYSGHTEVTIAAETNFLLPSELGRKV